MLTSSSPNSDRQHRLRDENDVDLQVLRVMRIRIQERMLWARTSIAGMETLSESSLSERIGRNPSFVNHLMKKAKRLPDPRDVENIAKVLQCNADWLYGRATVPDIMPSAPPGIFVIGAADVGNFRIMNATYPRYRRINTRFEDAPGANVFALDICDDVMNDHHGKDGEPEPLLKRMTAICIDLGSIDHRITTGEIYAIRQIVHANGKPLQQETIRRASVFPDRIEFSAESTKGPYEPLVLQLTDKNPTIKILGLVKWWGFQA